MSVRYLNPSARREILYEKLSKWNKNNDKFVCKCSTSVLTWIHTFIPVLVVDIRIFSSFYDMFSYRAGKMPDVDVKAQATLDQELKKFATQFEVPEGKEAEFCKFPTFNFSGK